MILFVDDDAVKTYACCHPMRSAGFAVLERQTGEEALAFLSVGKPDVIVADVGLMDTDGYELCKRVRAVSDIPFILVSSREIDKQRFEGCGANEFLEYQNPFLLLAAVKRYIS